MKRPNDDRGLNTSLSILPGLVASRGMVARSENLLSRRLTDAAGENSRLERLLIQLRRATVDRAHIARNSTRSLNCEVFKEA